MPQISLTDFVDVVSSSGTPKATKVRQIKTRPPYEPALDFYKPIRDTIVEAHERGMTKDYVDAALANLTDKKKSAAYPAIVSAYKSWWGRKGFVWFFPPSALYSSHGIDISINPELGLLIDGTPHLVKLYFKAEPLAKNRVDIITHLMTATVAATCPNPGETVMAVLDIRRKKLISPTTPVANLGAALDAELAYIAALWHSI
jgi:hypothetical protein